MSRAGGHGRHIHKVLGDWLKVFRLCLMLFLCSCQRNNTKAKFQRYSYAYAWYSSICYHASPGKVQPLRPSCLGMGNCLRRSSPEVSRGGGGVDGSNQISSCMWPNAMAKHPFVGR